MGKYIWKKIWMINGEVCPDSKVLNGQGQSIQYDENGNHFRKRIFKGGVEVKLSPPEGG